VADIAVYCVSCGFSEADGNGLSLCAKCFGRWLDTYLRYTGDGCPDWWAMERANEEFKTTIEEAFR